MSSIKHFENGSICGCPEWWGLSSRNPVAKPRGAPQDTAPSGCAALTLSKPVDVLATAGGDGKPTFSSNAGALSKLRTTTSTEVDSFPSSPSSGTLPEHTPNPLQTLILPSPSRTPPPKANIHQRTDVPPSTPSTGSTSSKYTCFFWYHSGYCRRHTPRSHCQF